MEKRVLNKIEDIYQDFRNNLDDRLCNLKKLTFASDFLPDYEDENIQRYYLLRYMMGYFCEYTCIYSDIIESDFLDNKYNILSIGCGCGIDFWGMKLAKRELLDNSAKVRYTGIDRVDWLYKDDFNDENEASFICKDINEINIFPQNDYNIIMFPKSIGEFKGKTFEHLKNIIRNTNFKSDKIIIALSIRSTRDEDDINKAYELISVLKEEYGYRAVGEPIEVEPYEKDENNTSYRLEEIIYDFKYPRHIFNYITSLYSKCECYKQNNISCDSDCELNMSRRPITTTSQVRYQIIRLERD